MQVVKLSRIENVEFEKHRGQNKDQKATFKHKLKPRNVFNTSLVDQFTHCLNQLPNGDEPSRRID